MATDLPIWAYPPAWGDAAYLETYSWLTDVMIDTILGAEQRQGLRRTPRRMIEAVYQVLSEERTRLDLLLQAAGGGRWRVPLWHVALLLQGLHAGDTAIDVDVRGRDIVAGTELLLYGQDSTQIEVATVDSIDANGRALLTAPIASAWPYATVAPLRVGWLTEQPRTVRYNGFAAQVQARFIFSGANPYTAAGPTLTYQGLPVLLSDQSDEGGGTNTALQRFTASLDNMTGGIYRRDTAARSVTTQSVMLTIQGVYAYSRLRDLLYTLAGRLNLLWVPTFANDFTLARAAASGDTTLVVHNVGYSLYGAAIADRQFAFIETTAGDRLCFALVGAAANGDASLETLSIDPPLPQTLDPAEIYTFCFLTLMRGARDDIEIVSESGVDGISTCALSLISEPDLRAGVPPATLQYGRPRLAGTFGGKVLVGQVYDATVALRGGNGTFILDGVTAGALPPGTVLELVDGPALRLHGTVTGDGGDAVFTITIESGDGQQATADCRIHIPVAILRTEWRLLLTPTKADSPIWLKEIELRGIPDGPDQTTNEASRVSASSEDAAIGPAAYAFDNIIHYDHSWRATATGSQWIRYSFPTPVDVNEVRLYGVGATDIP